METTTRPSRLRANESEVTPTFTYLDMDSDPDQAHTTPAIRQYETIYVTSHKAPCRAGAFSPDGMLIATGSADASIKILDVERMISKSASHAANQQPSGVGNNNNQNQNNSDNNNPNNGGDDPNNDLQNQNSNNGNDHSADQGSGNHNNSSSNQQHQNQQQQHQNQQHQHSSHNTHPVIRTLYDHSEEVTYLQFHPTSPVLASGSQDSTIKFYDYMRASAKRAHKTLQEVSPIRCFAFHPSGSYMLVGCQQPTLRLYDINSLKSFVSSNPLDQHNSPITMIDYSRNGSFYVTGSKDGDIKIWDGVSNRCVNTFRRAHDGAVSSVKISRNGKYILSSGKDSLVKLWEMNMCSCLMLYEGAQSSSSKNFRAQSVFNHTEDYVLYPDGRNTQLHSWNARTGRHLESLPLCHNNSVRFIVHSDVGPAFLSCSEDFRARFWTLRADKAND